MSPGGWVATGSFPEHSAHFFHMISGVFGLTRHISESGSCQKHLLAALISISKIQSCKQTLPRCQTEMKVNLSEDEEKTMKC